MFYRITQTGCLLIIVLVSAFFVAAQDKVKFSSAKADKDSGSWTITFAFNTSFNVNSVATAAYRVIDVQTQKGLTIVGSPEIENGRFIILTLDESVNLDCKKPYILYISSLDFPAEPTVKEVYTRITVNNPDCNAASVPRVVEKKPVYKWEKVDSGTRDDSDVYVSGQLTGASGEKVQYTTDIKIQLNLKSVTNNRKFIQYGPSFELLSSSVPDADPDSLKAGFYISYLPWKKKVNNETEAVRVRWKNTFGIESDRDFNNTNFLWDTRFTYLKKAIKFGKDCESAACLYFRPFIGQEFGVNLKSPVAEAEKKMIYRPYFGAALALKIPLFATKTIGFDSSYIRRFPLKREVTFSEDDDGNLTVVNFGRRPKDYVTGNLEFGFNDFWGAKITYEYGSVPPLYKLLDHKFGIGFTFRGDVKRR